MSAAVVSITQSWLKICLNFIGKKHKQASFWKQLMHRAIQRTALVKGQQHPAYGAGGFVHHATAA